MPGIRHISQLTGYSVYNHLFGPVPSRRLGLSLGIDLVAGKICTFDCLFCEVGSTTTLTSERKEYVPTEDVVNELEKWIRNGGVSNYITLAGSGEPTLHSKFGYIIDKIRGLTSTPIAILSNGSLFTDPAVRKDAAKADLVKVSLSAWDQASLEKVNRNHSKLKFDEIIEGYKAFRKQFTGRFWLEVFILKGINDSAESVSKIARLAKTFAPDRIQLNTAVRPVAHSTAEAVDEKELAKLERLFTPEAEIIASFKSGKKMGMVSHTEILAIMKRRPCTLDDIASVFAMSVKDADSMIASFKKQGKVKEEKRHDKIYYHARG